MTAFPLEQTDNPILWQEQVHQERNAVQRVCLSRLMLALLVLSLIGVMFLLLQQADSGNVMTVALLSVWGLQMAVSIRAIAAGANTISREHVGLTWDSLVLTGISVRKILFGKWRAALRSVRDMVVMLVVVRLAVLPIFSYGLVKVYLYYNYTYNTVSTYSGYAQARYQYEPPDFPLVLWAWLIAIVASIGLTGLEVLLSTAIGMVSSAVTKRGVPAAVLAIAIRFLPVIIFAAFMRYQLGITYFWRWWGQTLFSLSDGGTSAILVLGLPLMPWTEGDHVAALPGLILATLMMSIMLVAALAITWFIIRRTGALPQASIAPADSMQ